MSLFKPAPGSDLVWLSAVTKYIIDQGWHDEAFLRKHVNNVQTFIDSLAVYTLDYAEKATNLSKDEMIAVATAIHEADTTCILWAMGVTQHGGGSDTSTAISNLLLVTGNYMKPGAGAYPLRGHNNVQGASDFGSMPDRFPGYQFVSDDEVRQRYEQKWGVKIPAEPGLNNHEMVDAIHEGKLNILYLKGEDMGIVDSNANYVQAAFEKLDFFVVQDVVLFEKRPNSPMSSCQQARVLKKKGHLRIRSGVCKGYIKSLNHLAILALTG